MIDHAPWDEISTLWINFVFLVHPVSQPKCQRVDIFPPPVVFVASLFLRIDRVYLQQQQRRRISWPRRLQRSSVQTKPAPAGNNCVQQESEVKERRIDGEGILETFWGVSARRRFRRWCSRRSRRKMGGILSLTSLACCFTSTACTAGCALCPRWPPLTHLLLFFFSKFKYNIMLCSAYF